MACPVLSNCQTMGRGHTATCCRRGAQQGQPKPGGAPVLPRGGAGADQPHPAHRDAVGQLLLDHLAACRGRGVGGWEGGAGRWGRVTPQYPDGQGSESGRQGRQGRQAGRAGRQGRQGGSLGRQAGQAGSPRHPPRKSQASRRRLPMVQVSPASTGVMSSFRSLPSEQHSRAKRSHGQLIK